MARAKVNYTTTGQEFPGTSLLGARGRVLYGGKSLLQTGRKKTGYGLGARTWAASPGQLLQTDSSRGPISAANRSNGQTRE